MAREIEERRDFLETMTEAGHGQQYEPVIKAQIAEKVQELDAVTNGGSIGQKRTSHSRSTNCNV